MILRALVVPFAMVSTVPSLVVNARAEAPAPSRGEPPSRAVALPAARDPLWTDGRGGAASDAPVTMQSFVRLARAVGPAVVSIITVQLPDASDVAAAAAKGGHPQRGRGQGTGFIIHRAGLIVTNHHVVRNAESIKVRLSDERSYPATIVGHDEKTDLALLAVDAGAPLPVIRLGDSDKVEVGEWVMAIGNPFGLDHTFTVGIISAKGRRDVKPGGQSYAYSDFIQTDASINAGNSGGPLLNTRGEVVAINTAINAQGQGIAFSIPINLAKGILPPLFEHGRVDRTWFGVFTQALSPSLAKALKLPDVRGALITDVVPGSPAAEAGIQPGDAVVEFDGHALQRGDELSWWVARAGTARKVPLSLVRHGERRRVEVKLVELPASEGGAAVPAIPSEKPRASALGITVSEISAGIARELGQPDLHGLVVMSVEMESPAADAGVERGDLLLRVGDAALQDIEDYSKAIHRVAKGELIVMLLRRNGRSQWVAFPKR